jgi:PKD repeat protein
MTRFLSTWRGWLFAIFTAVFLTACDPIADIVVPQPVLAGQPAQFGSTMLEAHRDMPQEGLTYDWVFGDGGVATGPTPTHTYAQPGEYEVTLSISDEFTRKFGQAYISKAKVVVLAAGATAPLVVSVVTADNQPVAGAKVTIGNVTNAVVDLAQARFESVALDQPVIVRAQAPGFVSTAVQLVPVAGNAPAVRQAVVRMMPAAAPVPLEEIAAAGPVSIDKLQATVVLPANAFVNAKGEPARGVATMAITPWDITREADMAAFPGNRQARGESGATVSLISFGMMDVHVLDGEGRPLQLAPGKTAQISMDLPTDKDEKGQALAVGDTIPLWHFDEAAGLWVREGTGTVVASSTSASGLGVTATVSHFSSWNWDRVQDPAATAKTATLRCVRPSADGPVLVKDCNMLLKQTLANGSVLSTDLYAADGQVAYSMLVSTATLRVNAWSVQERRRGTLADVSVANIDGALDIVLDQTVPAVDLSGTVTMLDVNPVQLIFGNLPFEQGKLGVYNYPTIQSLTVTRGTESVALSGLGYGTVTDLYDEAGQYRGQGVSVGFPAAVPGVPGPLSTDKLSGSLTVTATMSFYTVAGYDQWGNAVYDPAPTSATLTTNVVVPAIDRTGPLLVKALPLAGLGQSRYYLWSDFPATRGIRSGDKVLVQLQQVDAFGMSTGEPAFSGTPDGAFLEIGSDHGFDISLRTLAFECGQVKRGYFVLQFQITGADGAIKTLTTRPVRLSEAGYCPV